MRRLGTLATLPVPAAQTKVSLIDPGLVDIDDAVALLVQLQYFSRVERAHNEAARGVRFEC